MKKTIIGVALGLTAVLGLLSSQHDADARGGRGGGGGGRVGGGGGGVSRPSGGGVSRPSVGSGAVSRPSVSPRPSVPSAGGGVLNGGSPSRGSGSWSGPGGGSISSDWGGKVINGPGGGKAVVGGKDTSITTPGGKNIEIDSGGIVGRGGGGGVVAGKGGVASGSGGRTIAGGKGIAAGDMGLAGYSRGAVSGTRGTAYVSRGALATQRGVVSRSFAHYNCFGAGWWPRYPNAWRAAAWTTAAIVWRGCTWDNCYGYCGLPAEPVYYDYGSNIVYDDTSVYVNGSVQGTVEEYANYAGGVADQGKEAKADEKDDWLPLGVFGMVQGEDKDANIIFQLAVNKAGVIRGNYYNALEDTTLPVYGSVDAKFRIAAWTVGDKKAPVYEAGIANLTNEATTMMVHFGPGRSQQWSLIRLEQPAETKDK